jgi:3-hydroxybutyryl-CoA dehydrogenase
MNIAAIGEPQRISELKQVLSLGQSNVQVLENTNNILSDNFDIIFDLNFDDNLDRIDIYKNLNSNTFLCLSAVKIQLENVLPKSLWKQTIGINALPSFLSRNSLEYCMADNVNLDKLKPLGWQNFYKVDSRVGMISPRVICMIINEAYFTLQEGTANKEDIDKGMKLGTAYPFGPFEWCEKIGIKNVYEVLKSLATDTADDRYKICSLLKTDYLRNA